ncbi:DUF2599 domain-containing protein [Frankia sp. Cpl3]|nr:DUF2599 domain-containing protein [Frankia sp. Cpl3]
MLESLNVQATHPYEDRGYEWVIASALFAVDPGARGNDRIVDLNRAPRDTDGRVRFEADVCLLRPAAGGNGRALLVVPNRGMLPGVPLSESMTAPTGTKVAPPSGDGFLLDRGWTIAWCGWQWDIPRDQGCFGLEAPVADVEPGWMRLEFRPDVPAPDRALNDSTLLLTCRDYPTADVHDPDATLTVRTSPLGPKQTVPRSHWQFTSPTRFTVDGGFQPFHYYELVYRSATAPVVGAGLLAVRDVGSHLKERYDHVFAAGSSQCGRLLRHFLFEGLNVDEGGRQVFDGMFAEVASARRGEFNQRYGRPGLLHPLTPAYGAPHDTASLLTRQRALGGTPKIIFTNSSWEYWRGDGALIHQDAHTGEDLPEDPDARVHLISGTDHLGAARGYKELMPAANPVHSLDASLIRRALFVQLEQWVCEGVEPSSSRVPRQADGTATTREKVLAGFSDAAVPDVEHLPWTPEIDPDSTTWPLELGRPLVALVSTVDASGNEVAGIRLPAVATAVAAYTGWNPRLHVDGLPDVLYELIGSRLPARTPTTPPDDQSLRAAAEALVAGRFLLLEDLELAVAQAQDQLGGGA